MQFPRHTNQPKSRCMYCSSPNIGRGCKYGPHGVHFHPNDSTKCAYCGSPNYGKGCKINPTSDLHIHGINYNAMLREHIQSFLNNQLLLNELKKNYKQFRCFELGIIDENGNKLKNPLTEEEKTSYTPFVKTIIKLKKYLGSKIDLIEAENNLKIKTVPINENIEYYKKILTYQDKLQDSLNEIYKIFDEAAREGLSQEDIFKLINA